MLVCYIGLYLVSTMISTLVLETVMRIESGLKSFCGPYLQQSNLISFTIYPWKLNHGQTIWDKNYGMKNELCLFSLAFALVIVKVIVMT